MELELTRHNFTPDSTIGTLSQVHKDGTRKIICKILEDVDRDLDHTDSLDKISRVKVHGRTAIPRGRYQIVVTESARFKRPLPLLLKVPGYEGIRIHTGNTAADTEGCLLPGMLASQNFVGQSKVAFVVLFAIIEKALKSEQVWVTVQ